MPIEKSDFERKVKHAFAFLEVEGIARFVGTRETNRGLPDRAVSCRYESVGMRLDIAYGEYEMIVMISIYLEREALSRNNRHIYLEPFVQFITQGQQRPVVPQVYYKSSIREIEKLSRERDFLFKDKGLTGILTELAERLRNYHSSVTGASDNDIVAYNNWYENYTGF